MLEQQPRPRAPQAGAARALSPGTKISSPALKRLPTHPSAVRKPRAAPHLPGLPQRQPSTGLWAHPNIPARCVPTSGEMYQWWGEHREPKGKIRARAGCFGTSHCHQNQIPSSLSCRNGPSPEIAGCKPRGAGLIP